MLENKIPRRWQMSSGCRLAMELMTYFLSLEIPGWGGVLCMTTAFYKGERVEAIKFGFNC